MEAYCPRCATVFTEPDAEAFADGVCASCDGQLISSAVTEPMQHLPGAFAATFETGSRVAIPYVPQLEQSSLVEAEVVGAEGDESNSSAAAGDEGQPDQEGDEPVSESEAALEEEPSSQATPPPAPPDEDADNTDDTGDGDIAPVAFMDEQGATPELETSEQDEQVASMGAPEGSPEDSDREGDAPESATPELPIDGQLPELELESSEESSGENAASTPELPAVGDGAPEQAAGAADDDSAAAVSEPEPEAPAATADADAGVPAHLSLPAMDFSMPSLPDFGDADGGAVDTAPAAPAVSAAAPSAEPQAAPPPTSAEPAQASAPTAEASDAPAAATDSALPAHLQLPSFPAFDINFDPDTAADQAADASAALEQEEQAKAASAQAPGLADAEAPAHLQPGPAAPPPLRKPAQAAAPAVAPAAAAGGALPALPSLGALPSFGTAPAHDHEVTLLAGDAAAAAEKVRERSAFLPVIIIMCVIVGAVAGVGFWQKDKIMSELNPESQAASVKESSEDHARRLLVKGLKAAGDARAAEKKGVAKRKRAEAIKQLTSALKLEPSLARAHRELAVVYATAKRQKKAIEHYRRYYDLSPAAEDAKDVKKIIDDWEKASDKK